VEAELLDADGETDGHDEANSRFSQNCEKGLITGVPEHACKQHLYHGASAAGRPATGLSNGNYPAAGRWIHCRSQDRAMWKVVCCPIFHSFVRQNSDTAGLSKTGTCERNQKGQQTLIFHDKKHKIADCLPETNLMCISLTLPSQ
jgi:hypothetical protein